MCRTKKEEKSKKEEFVDSAIRKKLRNKRKRDPDMRVEALLECTVRRLYAETLEFQSCYCPSPKRQKTTQDCEDKTKSKEILSKKITGYMGNIRGYLEKKVTSNLEDSTTNNKLRTPVSRPAAMEQNNVRTMKPYDKSLNSTNKRIEKEEDIDFETLFQSIVELTDSTSVSIVTSEDMDVDLNELIEDLTRETTITSCKDEDIFNNNDPFLPGMFEILCS